MGRIPKMKELRPCSTQLKLWHNRIRDLKRDIRRKEHEIVYWQDRIKKLENTKE